MLTDASNFNISNTDYNCDFYWNPDFQHHISLFRRAIEAELLLIYDNAIPIEEVQAFTETRVINHINWLIFSPDFIWCVRNAMEYRSKGGGVTGIQTTLPQTNTYLIHSFNRVGSFAVTIHASLGVKYVTALEKMQCSSRWPHGHMTSLSHSRKHV